MSGLLVWVCFRCCEISIWMCVRFMFLCIWERFLSWAVSTSMWVRFMSCACEFIFVLSRLRMCIRFMFCVFERVSCLELSISMCVRFMSCAFKYVSCLVMPRLSLWVRFVSCLSVWRHLCIVLSELLSVWVRFTYYMQSGLSIKVYELIIINILIIIRSIAFLYGEWGFCVTWNREEQILLHDYFSTASVSTSTSSFCCLHMSA